MHPLMASPDAASQIEQLIGDWWWLFLFVPGWVGAWFMGLGEWLEERGRIRHKRRMAELRAQAKLQSQQSLANAMYAAQLQTAMKQQAGGPCTHPPFQLVPIIAAGESQPAAWLCRGCDTQLDADVAVRKEDL